MTFWCGFGSADPCLWLEKKFFCMLIFVGTYIYIIFQRNKSKRSHNTVEIKVFLVNYFCLMIEGSGSIPLPDPDPGGPKTCGSGSGFGSGSATLHTTIQYQETFQCPQGLNAHLLNSTGSLIALDQCPPGLKCLKPYATWVLMAYGLRAHCVLNVYWPIVHWFPNVCRFNAHWVLDVYRRKDCWSWMLIDQGEGRQPPPALATWARWFKVV